MPGEGPTRTARNARPAFACAAVVALLSTFALSGQPVPTRPGPQDIAHSAFMRRMGAKAVEMGLSVSYFENASGLTKKSRTSASDLLKIGLAAAADPTISRIWAATGRTVRVGGPHAREERLVHGYTKLKGFGDFARRYPFLGGKGGSLQYDDLSVRTHVVVTEVCGRRLVIALAGLAYGDDAFAADVEVCEKAAVMLGGGKMPRTPVLDAIDAKRGGYAFATLDGGLRFESRHAGLAQVPASTTKIMTALCCVEVVKDVSSKLRIRARDIQGGSGYACHEGDEVSFEDALYSMMLPSSNTLAESVATAAGALMPECN